MNRFLLLQSKERFRLSWLDWLFIGGDLCLLVSVFFVWRQTTVANQPDILITAWQIGLFGGQGLFAVALLVLLLFGIGIVFFGRWQEQFVNVLWALVLLACFAFLTRQVLNFSVAGSPVLRTTLGLGFYIAIIGCNLLIFYCIFSVRRRKLSE